MVEAVFIFETPNQKPYARQLQISRLRSHAAKVAFSNRKPRTTRRRYNGVSGTAVDTDLKCDGDNHDVSFKSSRNAFNGFSGLRLPRSNGLRHKAFHSFSFHSLAQSTRPILMVTSADISVQDISLTLDWFVNTGSILSKVFNVTDNCSRWFVNTLQNTEYFLFATAAFVVRQAASLEKPGSHLPERYFKYYNRAIAKLRADLNEDRISDDEPVVTTVLLLALLEISNGNWTAYEIHKKQVSLMIAARGGLDSFRHDSLIKILLIQMEAYGGMGDESLVVPDFAASSRLEQDPQQIQLHLGSKLPTGFAYLAREGHLGINVLETLARVAREPALSTAAKPLSKHSECLPASTTVPCVFEVSATLTRLYWRDCSEGRHATIEELLWMALVVYCISGTDHLGCNVSTFGVRHGLTELLALNCHSTLSGSQKDCFIWISLVCIDSWRIMGTMRSQGLDLLRHLRRAMPELKLWTCEDLDLLCHKFFWTKDFSKRIHIAWRSVENSLYDL